MDRRGNIITGVWRVILTRGIAGVSIRAVADAAGVSLGLVQHYFPSKESLIHTSAQAMIDGAAERYESTVPDEEAVRHLVTHAIPTTDGMRDGAVVWHAYLAASVDDEPLARMLREGNPARSKNSPHDFSQG